MPIRPGSGSRYTHKHIAIHTYFHKHIARKGSTFVEPSKRVQKELVEKDEVIDGPSPEHMHRLAVLAARRRRAWRAWRVAGRRR